MDDQRENHRASRSSSSKNKGMQPQALTEEEKLDLFERLNAEDPDFRVVDDDESIQIVRMSLEEALDKKIKELLGERGKTTHPELIEMFRIAMSEPFDYGNSKWGDIPPESYDDVRYEMQHQMLATLTRYEGMKLDSGKELC